MMTMTRQDVITHRVVDGAASADELRELAELATMDDSVWGRVAEALRIDRTVSEGVDAAAMIAATIEAPHARAGITRASRHAGALRLRQWSGWAAAAVIAIAFVIVQIVNSPLTEPVPTTMIATAPTQPALDDVIHAYVQAGLEQGRVLRELPPVTVEINPTPDGLATEVTYVRRLLERTTIDQVYRIGHDEHGRPMAVPDSQRAPVIARSL